ncbi:MAG: hypothetical protein ACM3U2_05545 [Deltaproteobacteria bacterium]
MHTPLSALVLFAALSGGTRESTIYDDYKQAWRAARAQNLPVLVVLNPGADSETPSVDLDLLFRSGHRRDLLGKYVVVVVDTSTPQGAAVHKRFQSPALPRVSVLDRQQKWQVYRTSKALPAEDWNILLEKHQNGDPPAARAAPLVCRT